MSNKARAKQLREAADFLESLEEGTSSTAKITSLDPPPKSKGEPGEMDNSKKLAVAFLRKGME